MATTPPPSFSLLYLHLFQGLGLQGAVASSAVAVFPRQPPAGPADHHHQICGQPPENLATLRHNPLWVASCFPVLLGLPRSPSWSWDHVPATLGLMLVMPP